jgi:DNA-binding MarR family transcriptional regulator
MDAGVSTARHRNELTEAILDLFTQFCAAALTGQSEAWLSVELTLPQIKAAVQIVSLGRATGSQLARTLGIGLPSATRLVDRLAEHGLVTREEDAADRRTTYIVPTPAATQLVESLQSYRREFLSALLSSLDFNQLEEVERGLAHLALASRVFAQSDSQAVYTGADEPGRRQDG